MPLSYKQSDFAHAGVLASISYPRVLLERRVPTWSHLPGLDLSERSHWLISLKEIMAQSPSVQISVSQEADIAVVSYIALGLYFKIPITSVQLFIPTHCTILFTMHCCISSFCSPYYVPNFNLYRCAPNDIANAAANSLSLRNDVCHRT